MPASESTQLQVNLKTRGGTLINVYAADSAELSSMLEEVESVAAQIGALEGILNAASAASGIAAPPSQQSRGASSPSPAAGSATPSCVHGPRVYRKGVSKAGKPYEAWFCSNPDRDSQCKPEWG